MLSIGQRCVSVTGLRWLDLSLPMAREDSYFTGWPEDVVQRLGTMGVIANGGGPEEFATSIREQRDRLAAAAKALGLKAAQ